MIRSSWLFEVLYVFKNLHCHGNIRTSIWISHFFSVSWKSLFNFELATLFLFSLQNAALVVVCLLVTSWFHYLVLQVKFYNFHPHAIKFLWDFSFYTFLIGPSNFKKLTPVYSFFILGWTSRWVFKILQRREWKCRMGRIDSWCHSIHIYMVQGNLNCWSDVCLSKLWYAKQWLQ
jgi:hypothetical protein